ncbi:MAG: hypothetical protein AAF624_00815 [Bacteroidota bacterium]
MTRIVPFLLLVVAAFQALEAQARIQQQQAYTFEAGSGDERTLEAVLDIGLGSVRLERMDGRTPVFRAEGTLRDEALRPSFEYDFDGAHGEILLDVDSDDGVSLGGLRGADQNRWALFVSDDVTLDLDLSLGVGEADLDLTNLSVERFEVSTGMARTRVRFDRPNEVPMAMLSIEAGMAPVELLGLGNARFERLQFEGGMGSFRLDFSGDAFVRGARAHIEVGMAKLHLILPDDEPVVLMAPDSWVSRVRIPNGYVKHDEGVWHSPSVRDPSDALRIEVEAGMGSIECVLASDAR